jgi:hypothetical protein
MLFQQQITYDLLQFLAFLFMLFKIEPSREISHLHGLGVIRRLSLRASLSYLFKEDVLHLVSNQYIYKI